MSWTFNPPPGWPVPPGWQPPPGWTPDPSWPAPPEGWQFWTPGGPAGPPPAGPQPTGPPRTGPPAPAAPGGEPPWHQRWWAATGAMLSVLLLGCVLGGVVAVLGHEDSGGGTPTAPPAPTTRSPAPPGGPGAGGLRPGEERTGSGPAIVTLDLPRDQFHTVTVTFSGDGVFHSQLLNTEGEFARRLGGAIGDFSGTFPVELQAFGEPDAVDIVDGEGTWTVAVGLLADAPTWPDQTSGTGPAVLRLAPGTDITRVSVTHTGASNIFVYGHVEDGFEDLMVNEIGNWSGEVDLRPDTFALEISADGDWTVDPA